MTDPLASSSLARVTRSNNATVPFGAIAFMSMVAALACGYLALGRIKQAEARPEARVMALTGLGLGGVAAATMLISTVLTGL